MKISYFGFSLAQGKLDVLTTDKTIRLTQDLVISIKKEKKILQVKHKRNITFLEARKIVVLNGRKHLRFCCTEGGHNQPKQEIYHVFSVLFIALGTRLPSSTSFPMVSIFLAFEAPQGCWEILFNPLETIADFNFLEMFVTPYFLRASVISVIVNASYLHLITPLEVFTLSGGYVSHLVVWKLFILKMLLVSLRQSTSTSKIPFRVFFTFWRGSSVCDNLSY